MENITFNNENLRVCWKNMCKELQASHPILSSEIIKMMPTITGANIVTIKVSSKNLWNEIDNLYEYIKVTLCKYFNPKDISITLIRAFTIDQDKKRDKEKLEPHPREKQKNKKTEKSKEASNAKKNFRSPEKSIKVFTHNVLGKIRISIDNKNIPWICVSDAARIIKKDKCSMIKTFREKEVKKLLAPNIFFKGGTHNHTLYSNFVYGPSLIRYLDKRHLGELLKTFLLDLFSNLSKICGEHYSSLKEENNSKLRDARAEENSEFIETQNINTIEQAQREHVAKRDGLPPQPSKEESNDKICVFTREDFGQIRTSKDDTGEPIFCANDVCRALGYQNPRDAILKHIDSEDIVKSELLTTTGFKQTTFIYESGIYGLVFSSKLPKAREFGHWVKSEVLPSIRKTGFYKSPHINIPIDEGLNPDVVIQIATTWKRDRERRISAEKILNSQEQQIKTLSNTNLQLREKSAYLDIILRSPGDFTITQIAKDYGLSAKRMNTLLNELEIQFYLHNQWLLYAKYASFGYTVDRAIEINDDLTVHHTYWTPKGREFLYHKLKEKGILPLIEQDNNYSPPLLN